ncbi:MAG TPA: pirin family protein [Candidatus Limiplasma sp.]|nr:pirin family protein [Candidatus Limiplasma sp.]HRX09971.1 pirin family protein [Candidatus Limiplasma sp.]
MNERNIKRLVRGRRTSDGAGVRLVRVLANDTVEDFDPFLMLDSFDSTDPADYIAGFPMHPHRGIETITYLLAGRIDHEDSLGNKGSIRDGESQWMASGNGILHQEMPQPSERMLGFQLWLNMPRSEKMSHPSYLSITPHMIGRTHSGGAKLGVLSGRYGDTQGVTTGHIQATLIDVDLPKGESIKLDTKAGETVFVFLLKGDAQIGGQAVAEKSAVLFGDGDYVQVSAMPDQDLRFMVFSGKPLHEPVAWGGPIVMNTRAELDLAFQELREGTFIKHG